MYVYACKQRHYATASGIVALAVSGRTQRSRKPDGFSRIMQVQVAAAATALSTLAVAVAPAAQAAQEAFQLADVSVMPFLLGLDCV